MIEFYLEYLKRVKFEQHSRQIEIIGPCVAQLIKMMDSADDILRVLGPLKLLEHRIVLIPVNNQEQDTAGTHWSLMFFLPESRSFHHIDSLDPANNESAHKIAKSIVNGLDITGANIITYLDAGVHKNKHDCGVYVLRNAEKAIKQLFSV